MVGRERKLEKEYDGERDRWRKRMMGTGEREKY